MKKKKNCPMPGCWQEISLKSSFCPACRSWWSRVALKNPSELAHYIQRVGRFAGRLTRLKGKGKLKRIA